MVGFNGILLTFPFFPPQCSAVYLGRISLIPSSLPLNRRSRVEFVGNILDCLWATQTCLNQSSDREWQQSLKLRLKAMEVMASIATCENCCGERILGKGSYIFSNKEGMC